MLSARGPPRPHVNAAAHCLTPRAPGGRSLAFTLSRGATPERGVPRASTPRQAWQTPREHQGVSGEALRSATAAGLGLSAAQTDTGCGVAPPRRVRKGHDAAPDVPSAGKAGPPPQRASVILSHQGTPDSLSVVQKRHRRRTEAGEISTNWALEGVPKPPPGIGYGIKNVKGVNVVDSMKAAEMSGVAEYINKRGEATYYSTVREPLGKSWCRGHQLPEATQRAEFLGFGSATLPSESAKEIIHPHADAETQEAAEMYKKTHGDYDPGEAARRGYVWPGAVLDNEHFRFGFAEPDPGQAGVRGALSMEKEDDGSFLRTVVVKSRDQGRRQFVGDPLGCGRNLMQGEIPVPPGHSFGVKTPRDNNMCDVVKGNYPVEEQKPDSDLGCCTIPGRRNVETGYRQGMPTVRLDRPCPGAARSIADSRNYGDELDAFEILYPSRFKSKGLTHEDMSAPRSREELAELCEKAGAKIDHQDFEPLFDLALNATQGARRAPLGGSTAQDPGGVSVGAMMSLYYSWEEAGRPPLR